MSYFGMKVRRALWRAAKLPESPWVNKILDEDERRHNSPERKAERAVRRRHYMRTTVPAALVISIMTFGTAAWYLPGLVTPSMAFTGAAIFSLLIIFLFWPDR
jgi:multisubunit Na+/H+ antiporter MnhB subunit